MTYYNVRGDQIHVCSWAFWCWTNSTSWYFDWWSDNNCNDLWAYWSRYVLLAFPFLKTLCSFINYLNQFSLLLAAGLGNYVEALVRRHETEFNVCCSCFSIKLIIKGMFLYEVYTMKYQVYSCDGLLHRNFSVLSYLDMVLQSSNKPEMWEMASLDSFTWSTSSLKIMTRKYICRIIASCSSFFFRPSCFMVLWLVIVLVDNVREQP